MASNAPTSSSSPSPQGSRPQWAIPVLAVLAGLVVVCAGLFGYAFLRAKAAIGKGGQQCEAEEIAVAESERWQLVPGAVPPAFPLPDPAPGVKSPASMPACAIGKLRYPLPWPRSPTRRDFDQGLRQEIVTSTHLVDSIARRVPGYLDLVVEFNIGPDATPTKVTLTSPRQVTAADKATIEAALVGCRFSDRMAGRDATWMESDSALESIRTGGPGRRLMDLTPHQLRRRQPRE